MNYAKARHNMIASQVRTWDVSDEAVLRAMEALPREDFVPEAWQHFAYTDMAIPLGEGQTLLPPGTGYLTALCAFLGAKVTSVDINPARQQQAKQSFAQHGLSDIDLITADASQGFASSTLFDVIIITGGLPALPEAYKNLLKPHGRLFAIIGKKPAMQATLFHYLGNNQWFDTVLYETVVPMMEHTPIQKEFIF
jgi:protein-L-isoaspartate(D-aspartate) O-methyltransferase